MKREYIKNLCKIKKCRSEGMNSIMKMLGNKKNCVCVRVRACAVCCRKQTESHVSRHKIYLLHFESQIQYKELCSGCTKYLLFCLPSFEVVTTRTFPKL